MTRDIPNKERTVVDSILWDKEIEGNLHLSSLDWVCLYHNGSREIHILKKCLEFIRFELSEIKKTSLE